MKRPSNNNKPRDSSTGASHQPRETCVALVKPSSNDVSSFARQLLKLQETERRAVSRDLHDVTGQSLTVLKLVLDKAARCSSEELPEVLTEAVGLVDEAAERLRSISRGLRPGILDLSLLGALQWQFEDFTRRTSLAISFQHRGLKENYSQDVNTAVYRIVQRALENSARNVSISHIEVNVTAWKNKLTFRVSDTGQGFNPVTSITASECGLQELQERAAMCGGWLEIQVSPGKGTIITAEIPLVSSNKDKKQI
jgi:signal transduction histidine kinase